jgi:GDP-mannose 6-dehydrogenase
MKISIFGLGYVGCVASGCLAQMGHHVIGVDAQQTKVDFINQGRPTIIEEGIAEILAETTARGQVRATCSAQEAIRDSEVSFICVGTPSTSNGHLDLTAITKVAEQIGDALRDKAGRHVIAVRSTVLPGTRESVERLVAAHSGKVPDVDFSVVSNPEFLREGTSVKDFLKPPYTLIGSECEWAIEVMRSVYKAIDAPFVTAEPRVAELMKYVCNSFHALKVVFANEVGNICQKLHVDGQKLMEIFCMDTKLNISKAYLRPGFAYGGSCLPKDLKALRTIAHDHYLQTPVLAAIPESNELQKELVFKQILESGKQNVGFIGLAFKSGTDDLRESPIVDVLERLLGKGFNVRIYDPYVHISRLTGANKDYIISKIPYISRFITDDLNAVASASDLLVVVNKEPKLGELLRSLPSQKQLIRLTFD